MKLSRKGFVFIVLIISAIIVGGYIGQQTSSGILSHTASFGFSHDSPLTLDLIIFTISLGFTFNVSIAQILCIVCAIAVFTIFSKFID